MWLFCPKRVTGPLIPLATPYPASCPPSGLDPHASRPNPREPFTRARRNSTPLFHTRGGGNCMDLDGGSEVRLHLSLLSVPHACLSFSLWWEVGGATDDKGTTGWGGGRGSSGVRVQGWRVGISNVLRPWKRRRWRWRLNSGCWLAGGGMGLDLR
jgi:hypothetical protein